MSQSYSACPQWCDALHHDDGHSGPHATVHDHTGAAATAWPVQAPNCPPRLFVDLSDPIGGPLHGPLELDADQALDLAAKLQQGADTIAGQPPRRTARVLALLDDGGRARVGTVEVPLA